jgi:hypothetical protein
VSPIPNVTSIIIINQSEFQWLCCFFCHVVGPHGLEN